MALLASIHPALVLLTLCALPPVLTSSWRPGVERRAQERGSQANRLSRHLFDVATTAAPGKDVRVTGIAATLAGRRRQTWEAGQAPIAAARWISALWHAAAWAVFGAGYVGAIVFVTSGVGAPAGDVLLMLAAGSRLSFYVGAAVGEIGFLRGVWMDSARRLAWLEDYAAAVVAAAEQPAPRRLTRGVRFDHVSFAYPGTERLVLEDVSLDLPAGTVVAIVGENGAGKTTLVKLLARMYAPTRGRDPGRRRRSGGGVGRRLAHPAGRCVPGLLPLRVPRSALGRPRRSAAPRRWTGGDHGGEPRRGRRRGRRGCRPGSTRSSDRPGRAASRSASGSGRSWPWPAGSCAIGRCCSCSTSRPRRSTPKPSTRCSSATRRPCAETTARAGSPILVSHRFSTVRMADLIVVLDGARVVETGTHEALVARGGQYAELYALQAAAYR